MTWSLQSYCTSSAADFFCFFFFPAGFGTLLSLTLYNATSMSSMRAATRHASCPWSAVLPFNVPAMKSHHSLGVLGCIMPRLGGWESLSWISR